MRPVLKVAAFAVLATATLLASAILWYAFSTPRVVNLPLAVDLIANSSSQGAQLLRSAPDKTDFYQLQPNLVPQDRRAFCGPATSVAVLNAALRPQAKVTQSSLFDPAVSTIKSELAATFSGLTLDELAGILRARGLQVRVIHADQSDVASFRAAAQATLTEPLVFLVVNYDRRTLGQSGVGHISPVGAFSPDSDRLLILDVATYKYPYTWVPVHKLWRAMNTVDSSSMRIRGYLLISANAVPVPPGVGAVSR